MKAAWLIPLLLVFPVHAADQKCPTSKPLTCEQLLTKAKQRHCLEDKTAAAIPVAAPCTAVPCTSVPCGPVACIPGPPTVVTAFIPSQPVPRGNWFAGGGAVYNAGWGLQAVGGYKWSSGWSLMVGPNWIDHSGSSGSVYGCFGEDRHHGGHDDDCGYLPYSVPARSEWGGTAMLLYNFQ